MQFPQGPEPGPGSRSNAEADMQCRSPQRWALGLHESLDFRTSVSSLLGGMKKNTLCTFSPE